MIIAADLTSEKEKKVVETLRNYKEAIAWSMEDLKGIIPSICMHKILMEENAKTSIEYDAPNPGLTTRQPAENLCLM